MTSLPLSHHVTTHLSHNSTNPLSHDVTNPSNSLLFPCSDRRVTPHLTGTAPRLALERVAQREVVLAALLKQLFHPEVWGHITVILIRTQLDERKKIALEVTWVYI